MHWLIPYMKSVSIFVVYTNQFPFSFNRTDLYSEEPISLCDIKFEQASILHNLGWYQFLDQMLWFSLTTLESNWCGKVNSAELYKYINVKMSYINAMYR